MKRNATKKLHNETPGAKGKVSLWDIELGERLRTARTLKKLTQKDVASALGVSFQQIQKYERGENRVSAVRLVQFCRLFEQPYGFFLNNLEQKQSPQNFDAPSFSDDLSRNERLILAVESLPNEHWRNIVVNFSEHMVELSKQHTENK